jgi:hypothetical protein
MMNDRRQGHHSVITLFGPHRERRYPNLSVSTEPLSQCLELGIYIVAQLPDALGVSGDLDYLLGESGVKIADCSMPVRSLFRDLLLQTGKKSIDSFDRAGRAGFVSRQAVIQFLNVIGSGHRRRPEALDGSLYLSETATDFLHLQAAGFAFGLLL